MEPPQCLRKRSSDSCEDSESAVVTEKSWEKDVTVQGPHPLNPSPPAVGEIIHPLQQEGSALIIDVPSLQSSGAPHLGRPPGLSPGLGWGGKSP